MHRTIPELLVEQDIFAGLPQEYLDLIAGCAHNAVFQPGQFLFKAGQPAERFYVLREGRVTLEMHTPERGSLVVDAVEAGEVAGVSWLFPPHRWLFDGRAAVLTRAVSLDGACLLGKCEADPRLGYELMKRFATVLNRRLDSARVRLVDLYGSGHPA